MFQGIPLHPLAVHFGVVLGLLGAGAVLVAAVLPRFRTWLGWGLPLAGVIAGVALQVTASLGEALQESGAGYNTAAVRDHAQFGDMAGSAGIGLAVVSVLLWLTMAEYPRSRWTGHWPSWVSRIVQTTAVGVSLAALAVITLAGHTGAAAVWAS